MKECNTYVPEILEGGPVPIYEFRCMGCNELFEVLSVRASADEAVRCPHCGGESLERVLSRVARTRGDGSGDGGAAEATTRSCPSGSCGTFTLPGHTE